MDKWAVPCGAVLFLRLQKGPRHSDFSRGPFVPNARKNYYSLAVSTHFWSRSKFNSVANIDPLMANDGSLKLPQQDGLDLGLFVGGRHNYKNNNLVQGKQTVR